MKNFAPIRVTEVELSEPLPHVAPLPTPDARTYGGLHALVRLHGSPLGVVTADLANGELPADELARVIREQLGSRIDAHLEADGLAGAGELTPAGIPTSSTPPCRSRAEHVPFVSVVIPTRDGAGRLRTCLESVLNGDYPAERFEVVVVDNGSVTDATERVVEEFDDHRVRCIREETPGSASARNAGAAIAGGEVLAFTDDDTRVDREWLSSLAEAFAAMPNVGCVTGLILPLEIETPAQALIEEFGGFSKGFDRRVYDLRDFRPATPTFPYSAGRFGSGQNMAFSAEAFRALGGFDPALGNGTPALGGVDIEMFFRTIVQGYRLVYEPRAIVHHANHREYERLRRQVYMYGVGVSAFLARSLVARPDLLRDFLRRVPSGVRYALSPASEKNAHRTNRYPRELRWLELIGLVVGPFAYARSRRVMAKSRDDSSGEQNALSASTSPRP